jgi:transketolase
MAAACNGMTLSGLRAFGATFFVFTDYMRPSMRLSAIMGLPVLYVLTHDSIGVGEDGPTHQPVEHLAALRAMPRMLVMRPGDANEVSEAYRAALSEKHRPTAMVLSRQNVPTLDRTKYAPPAGVRRGAYVLFDPPGGKLAAIVMASGTELPIAVAAAETLNGAGVPTRIVSVPCWELFEDQDEAYRQTVFPAEVTARVAVEAGVAMGWEKHLGPRGRFVGMSGYGASAPFATLYKHFGITPEAVVAAVRDILGK